MSHVLNTVPKVKNRMVVWVQNGFEYTDHMTGWEVGLTATAQHHESIKVHTASLEKDQNSRPEVQFLLNSYCFCTIIKSKIH